MGASIFIVYQPGADPDEAFRAAAAQARHDHGHGGYTGTIAEKNSYTVITHTPQTSEQAKATAQQLMTANDDRIRDRAGPAGAIPVKDPTRSRLVSHSPLQQRGDHDTEPLRRITESARAAGLISADETVTATRRYDPARIDLTINKDPATLTASTEPDGWLFFGWASD